MFFCYATGPTKLHVQNELGFHGQTSIYSKTYTPLEINISHLGKRKIIFKYALSGGYVNSLEGIYFQHFHTLVGIASPKMNCWEDAIDLCKGHMDKTQRCASSYLYINGASIYILSIYLYSIYPSIHPYLYLYLSIYLSIHSYIDQWIDRLDVSKIAQK